MQIPKIGVDGALFLIAVVLLLLVGCRHVATVKDPPTSQELNVASVIETLRQQLLEMEVSLEESGNEPLFTVEETTVTLSFVAKESESAKGGVDFQIITAGASKSVATEAVQTITVKLKPYTFSETKPPSKPAKE